MPSLRTKLKEIKRKITKPRTFKVKPFGILHFGRSHSSPNLRNYEIGYSETKQDSPAETLKEQDDISNDSRDVHDNMTMESDFLEADENPSDMTERPGSRLNWDTMYLNGKRRRKYPSTSRTHLNISNNSSLTTGGEKLEPIGRTFSDYRSESTQNELFREEEEYLKYIPVLEKYGNFFPKSQLDNTFPYCWLSIQSWYLKYRTQSVEKSRTKRNNKLPRSKSDCSLSETNSSDCHSVIPDFNASFSASTSIGSPTKQEFNPQKGINSDVISLHPRYNEILNERYCVVASIANPRDLSPFDVDFVMEEELDDSYLRTTKVQLLTSCLRSFFFPCKQTSVHIIQRLCDKYRHLFSGAKVWDQVDQTEKSSYPIKAILFVSERASVILRHKDLCFLDTLCVIAEISRLELLVLHDQNKEDWISAIHQTGTVRTLYGNRESD